MSDGAAILALSAHARAVPTEDRQRFAAEVRISSTRSPHVLLETCHRVDVYATDDAWLPVAPSGTIRRDGVDAVRHAITVAVGLDSAVVGEDQVLHQLRAAVAEGRRGARPLPPALERLFSVALRAGRQARSWRPGPSRSLADVALDRIEASEGPLRGKAVLVVGTGTIGRLALAGAQRRGATTHVASRTRATAVAAAEAAGTSVRDWDDLGVADMDAIVVALRGEWRLTARTTARLMARRPTIVDLSTPPALPPALARALAERCIPVDTLLDDGTLSPAATARARALVEEATGEMCAWLEAAGRRDAIRALATRADHEREQELRALWRRLPQLDDSARAEIESMSRHLTGRLLRDPMQRLREDEDGRHELAARDLFRL
jgi:glutamyl-tRNA reductase